MKTINHSIILDDDDQASVEVTSVHGLPSARLIVRTGSLLSSLTLYLSAEQVDHLLLTAVATQYELDAKKAEVTQ